MSLQVRQLTDEELTRMFPRRGQMDLTEYEGIFDGATAGQGFEVEENGMSTRALKRRLGQAVKRALGSGYSLKYKSVRPDSSAVAFVVKAPRVAIEHTEPPQTRSNGRRRRRTAVAA